MVTSVPYKISVKAEADGLKLPPEQGVTETVWKQEHDPVKLISWVMVKVIEVYSYVLSPSEIVITLHP